MPSSEAEINQSHRKMPPDEESNFPWDNEVDEAEGERSPEEADEDGDSEQDGDSEGDVVDGDLEQNDGEVSDGGDSNGLEQEQETSPPENDGEEYPDGELLDGEHADGGNTTGTISPATEDAEEEPLDGEPQDGTDVDGENTDDTEQEIQSEENPSEDGMVLNTIAHVDYVIGIPPNSKRAIVYIRDLEASMDIVATQVGVSHEADVQIPSKVDSILEVDCPSFIDPSDRCKHVEASVELGNIGLNTAEFEAVSDAYRTQLMNAIEQQELQEALDVVNAESKVYIVTGIIPPTQNADDAISSNFSANKNEKLSQGMQKGAFIGMAAVGLCILLLLSAFVLHWRRRRRSIEKENDSSLESTADGQFPSPANSRAGKGPSPDAQVTSNDACARKSHERDEENLMDEISSIASSSVCYCPNSSILGPPSTQHEDDWRRVIMSQGSRDLTNLDDVIRNGDWRTTGDTAAILADDSTYASSVYTLGQNLQSLVNPDLVADLDKWIEAGDWQEILNAANRHESENVNTDASYLPTSYRDSSLLDDDVESRVSVASSRISLVSIVESVHTALGYESACENRSLTLGVPNGSSEAQTDDNRRQEIRDEIEVLVKDFLPEEIENIQELMVHFEGIEEELLHTVKTMQVRYATQRNRLARKTPPPTVSAITTRMKSGNATSALGHYVHDDSESSSAHTEFDLNQALAPSSADDAGLKRR